MAGLPKESAKNLAGVEFHMYLEERTMSTRFWSCSHLTSPLTYRQNSVSLIRHLHISRASRRDKTGPRKEISDFEWDCSRDAGEKRGARLRWAYEHEKLTNKFFQDVEHFYHIMGVDSPANAEELSTLGPLTKSSTVRQWAHQRDQA